VRDTRLGSRRIIGFGLTSPDAARLTAFYATAFGAQHVSSEHLGGARFERQLGVRGGALRHNLKLGDEAIDILQFDTPGRPYLRLLFPDDTAFQHFAIVVSNMDLALAHLQRAPGWTPISIGGPQRLPPRSGGVTAFKFQDPDGHPLELLAFPEHAAPPHWTERSAHGIFLGVDHSAIGVRDTAISTAFYQSLGFTVTAQTFNHGVEQANLDGVPSPQVEVTALSLAASIPHLELLCYRSGIHLPRKVLSSNDVAATRIALADDGLNNDVDAPRQLVVDPDGHHLLFVRDLAAQRPLTRGEPV
jgi:catechol 2,3-dioxygenase-like lactoylglutathione lyase family enzyme